MADGKTILVVDDDQELSDGLRIVLERQGHRVLQARDGQQGKQMVYQHHPDLVILDMMMPRMGGYPVLEHFRGKPDAPAIIMITANEGSRHKAYAEYLGVVDYIRKPFAMERLLESVERGLNQNERRRGTPSGKSRVRPVGRRRSLSVSPPIAAASVLLVRQSSQQEVFVVERARSLRFFGGFLAFPGGKVHDADALVPVVAGQRWPRAMPQSSWTGAWPLHASCSKRPASCWPARRAEISRHRLPTWLSAVEH